MTATKNGVTYANLSAIQTAAFKGEGWIFGSDTEALGDNHLPDLDRMGIDELPSIDSMTVPEWLQFAHERNINIGNATRKDEIYHTIAGALGSEQR